MQTVLIVDDERAILFIFRILLEEAGYSVESAATGQEAIAKLNNQHFDAVVTDVRMETPAAGFDVLRAAKQLPNPPVVVLVTAFPVLLDVWKKAGADELIVKGGLSQNLVDVLQRLLPE